ncbi:hypothetical protein ATCC90586_001706 [Pythium insidiosum]|nr:hypothetical protein ATCC90586_001706 [Pythium insidiosum]
MFLAILAIVVAVSHRRRLEERMPERRSMTMELSEMFLACKVDDARACAAPVGAARVSLAVAAETAREPADVEASACSRDSYETSRSRDSFAMLDGDVTQPAASPIEQSVVIFE